MGTLPTSTVGKMAKIELLGLIFNQGFRAVPELFRAVEKTITDYQGKDCLSKEENDRLQKLLDILLKPEIQLHRADHQQLNATEEEVPPEQQHCEQERSPSLGQDDSEPTQIKEEQVVLRTSQKLEYNTKDSVLTHPCVKSDAAFRPPLTMDRVGSIPEFTYGPTKEFCRSSLYFQTLQACWEEVYYNKQKKLMGHYLLLQSRGQVSPHVTMEHMSDWLVSQGKKSLRRECEYHVSSHLHCHSLSPAALQEGVEGNPGGGNELARLTWEVNTCLKMIDMEHEAVCKLRRSMHPTSPAGADIDPKVHSIVERAVRSILDKLSNKPCSNLLSPSQVVVELVPRILLALWLQPEEGHSDHPILLSGMAVKSYFQPTADTLPVPPVLVVAVSATLPADIQADADLASSHLEVVDITPNKEAHLASSHLELVDITPKHRVVDVTLEEKPLMVAVSATLPSAIQAEDVAVVTPDVTPTRHQGRDPGCSMQGEERGSPAFFLQALEGSVLLRLPQGRGGTILTIH
ncbi:hypothetical protein J4Q44_G00117720 [Coregonus suidteri]|uniref:Uncharacterized protein n=1 Tax=Coregonus suidteri TaxID=861788 RepID=A0AAN8MLS1_9TELE